MGIMQLRGIGGLQKIAAPNELQNKQLRTVYNLGYEEGVRLLVRGIVYITPKRGESFLVRDEHVQALLSMHEAGKLSLKAPNAIIGGQHTVIPEGFKLVPISDDDESGVAEEAVNSVPGDEPVVDPQTDLVQDAQQVVKENQPVKKTRASK